MNSAVIWGLLAAAGLGYEAYTLAHREDRHQPLTYHLRIAASRSWVKVGMVAFWIWLPLHLLGVVP